MKRFMLFGFALALLVTMVWFTAATPAKVAAFDHTWLNYQATNVDPDEFALWDDIAAGKPPSEAGLLWFYSDGESLDENIAYKTTDVNISTDTYPVLKARAALSDGGEFSVGVAFDDPQKQCNFSGKLKWPWKQGHGGYKVKSVTLPAHKTVRVICLFLTDYEDDVSAGRANVLIDYIRLEDSEGKAGWWEDFAGSP